MQILETFLYFRGHHNLQGALREKFEVQEASPWPLSTTGHFSGTIVETCSEWISKETPLRLWAEIRNFRGHLDVLGNTISEGNIRLDPSNIVSFGLNHAPCTVRVLCRKVQPMVCKGDISVECWCVYFRGHRIPKSSLLGSLLASVLENTCPRK